jgi:ribonuclease HI
VKAASGVLVAAADGSSLRNPGPAGWAWIVDADHWAAGGWPHGTNNMGELTAVLDLLRQTRGTAHLHILCDSQYAINVCTEWLPRWKANGWRKADKKPILNRDLVEALDDALQGRRVTFEWVKGHAGHPLNEAADRLARGAAEAYQAGLTPDPGPGFGPSPCPPEDPAGAAHGVTAVVAPVTAEAVQPSLFD